MSHAATRAAGAATALLMALSSAPAADAQTFLRITSSSNPIVVSGASPKPYTGASWMDYDGDGDDDLFVSATGLFRNDGAGAFALVPNALPNQGAAFANTWADIDNDGDLDAFVSGGLLSFPTGSPPRGSAFYLNEGGVFTKLVAGAAADTLGNASWGSAFGDYDGDGRVDLVTAAAFGFAGINVPNRLLRNLGGGLFARVDSAAMTSPTAPYTNVTWSDYDLDGDLDVFFATGPANGSLIRDYLYRNRNESSTAWFQRINNAPLGTDLQDGQLYNWIDYDNDGDLDTYLTNYNGTAPNRLYRNEGGGAFTNVTTAGPIVTENLQSLASVWQDFDNDGDLDCLVTNDGTGPLRFHRNNGNGTFTNAPVPGLSVPGPHWGAASADWDDDGLMDLFITGPAGNHMLLRNSTVTASKWLKVRLTGTVSNRAAIGARVRARAVIGGVPRWQLRELSAQNSFGGMNSLVAHFGLVDAASVDSVVVEWPSGLTSVLTDVASNSRLHVVEDGPTARQVALARADAAPDRVSLHWVLSGTFDPRVEIERRSGDGDWTRQVSLAADGGGDLRYDDTDIAPGGSYGYRLRVLDGTESLTVGEVWATVPAARGLAIDSVWPNPSADRLEVRFALAGAEPATLELFDVGGRRVADETLASPAPGAHRRTFGIERPLPAGVYMVRLTQGARSAVARAVVIR